MSRIESLEIFTAVVDAGSFTAAADRLGVSKSHVSKKVTELEDRLGARLLNRTTRSLDLTDVGSAFYERASRIVAEIDEAERAVTQLQTTPRGKLRVSAPMSFGLSYVAPAVGEFLRRHEELEIDIDFSDRKVDLLDEGFDLAIRIGELTDSSFMVRKLADTVRYCCASASFVERHGAPRKPEDLSDLPCLQYAYLSSTSWSFSNGEESRSVRVSGPLKANNGDALLRACLCDVGVGLFPDFIAEPYVRNGQLLRVLTEWSNWDAGIFALYPHNRHLSTKVRAFVDFMAEKLDPPPWLSA